MKFAVWSSELKNPAKKVLSCLKPIFLLKFLNLFCLTQNEKPWKFTGLLLSDGLDFVLR